MAERKLSPRGSVVSFLVVTVVTTAAAVGLFVLLDPRAQAFWGSRLGDLFSGLRGLFGGS